MDWIELTVLTTSEGAEAVSAALIEAGSNGVMIEDRRDIDDYTNSRPEGRWDILDEAIRRNMSEDVRVTGYYPADFRASDIVPDVTARLDALRARAGAIDLGKLTLSTSNLDDEDWAESWKAAFTPIRLGRHTVVKPGWCTFDAQAGDRVIELDPGMAFGTGAHETTALCVGLVEETVAPGCAVVDVGTGTGILAIAAALAGAKTVLATDIDPVAVRVATENIAANHLSAVIRTRQGDLLQAVDVVADVVVANIIADVIAMIAAPVKAFLKPGGHFICSGIAREKQDAVIAALRAAGYQDLDVRELGEWAAIRCRRDGSCTGSC